MLCVCLIFLVASLLKLRSESLITTVLSIEVEGESEEECSLVSSSSVLLYESQESSKLESRRLAESFEMFQVKPYSGGVKEDHTGYLSLEQRSDENLALFVIGDGLNSEEVSEVKGASVCNLL